MILVSLQTEKQGQIKYLTSFELTEKLATPPIFECGSMVGWSCVPCRLMPQPPSPSSLSPFLLAVLLFQALEFKILFLYALLGASPRMCMWPLCLVFSKYDQLKKNNTALLSCFYLQKSKLYYLQIDLLWLGFLYIRGINTNAL